MTEQAWSRAPLGTGRPALLLLLCSLCVVCVPARPSLRPSSPDEFRKLLLWAQNAAEHGELEPAYPSAEQLNEVDKIWSRSHRKGYLHDAELIARPHRPYVQASDFRRGHLSNENLPSGFGRGHPSSEEAEKRPSESSVTESIPVAEQQQSTTNSVPVNNQQHPATIRSVNDPQDSQKEAMPSTNLQPPARDPTLKSPSTEVQNPETIKIPVTDLQPPATETVPATDLQPPATESIPVVELEPPAASSELPTDRRIFPKKTDHTRSRPISETLTYYTDDSPDDEKNLEGLSHASIVYLGDKEHAQEKEAELVEDSKGEASSRPVLPAEIPPVFGHSILSDELSGLSVSKLPSYEEYDRNERYSHSFLHGFSGF